MPVRHELVCCAAESEKYYLSAARFWNERREGKQNDSTQQTFGEQIFFLGKRSFLERSSNEATTLLIKYCIKKPPRRWEANAHTVTRFAYEVLVKHARTPHDVIQSLFPEGDVALAAAGARGGAGGTSGVGIKREPPDDDGEEHAGEKFPLTNIHEKQTC